MPETTSNDHGQEALAEALSTSFRLLRYGLLILAVCYLFSGIFVVQQSERAFVLTFGSLGKPAAAAHKPGLHVTWPRPFTSLHRIPFDTTESITVVSARWPCTTPIALPSPSSATSVGENASSGPRGSTSRSPIGSPRYASGKRTGVWRARPYAATFFFTAMAFYG